MCIYTRHEPIMLFKLPIMVLSIAPKFSLLCPNYAPLWPIMLHKKDQYSNLNFTLKHAYMCIAMYLVLIKVYSK